MGCPSHLLPIDSKKSAQDTSRTLACKGRVSWPSLPLENLNLSDEQMKHFLDEITTQTYELPIDLVIAPVVSIMVVGHDEHRGKD